MKVASLVSSEWCDRPRTSYSSQPSPAASLSGSVRKFDEYQEKPSPITTAATSYFSAMNGSGRTSMQLPLSPPADDQRKCSLPSISSLLEGMDSSSSLDRASSLSISSLASPRDIPSPSPTTASTTTTITTPKSYYADEQPYNRTHASHSSSAPGTPSSHIPPSSSMVNAGWQHHHYFPLSTAAAAAYPQNHERYVCRTCHKAFSRPSSLRIHSHSHTGEKPFRCTHAGCGKAFSVRSNMKRHERGCHSGRPLAATALV
ncbi:hypothetical protein UA08_02915 [Talaromyces atroroseus]|uniref:C2H2-type domain-containing protein n=1 Tax=Talaromyces atroroseus TaxID=1441469 RepID=A0A225AM79_TALAT|nr:hypothetical protein UA08_02915 [Talaromyces atroroseus]OKL62000.1 hypothetical protein UA08_02915 [Talaromyces atroroseus]